MTKEQYIKNLEAPVRVVDVVLDTDAFNEVDDQFAISYLIKNADKFNLCGICAAPFLNTRSVSPLDGMEKSYKEILKLQELIGSAVPTYKGSDKYLPDEQTPVLSDAAKFIALEAEKHSPENPLYLLSIGALTNVASAILLNPNVCENCVIVFLGGRATGVTEGAGEFNMKQDIAASRVLFGSSVPLVQIAGKGVTDRLLTSKFELEFWLKGKNKLCDYLYNTVVTEAESYAAGTAWSRVIWDVVAVAWLMNSKLGALEEIIIPAPMPEYDLSYSFDSLRRKIKYIQWVNRDKIFTDLFETLTK